MKRAHEIMHNSTRSFLVLVFGLLFHSWALAATPIPKAPEVGAKGYLIQDFLSGQSIAEMNADEPLEPASITKMMTAYVIFNEIRNGSLALSDLLMVWGAPTVPWANHLSDLAAYEALLAEVGFERIRVEPALEETWAGFRRHFSTFISSRGGRYGWLTASRDLFFTNVTLNSLIRDGLIASAQKPRP